MSAKRAAFSLIELMIVLVIMGLLYNFATSALGKVIKKEQGKLPSLTNLRSFLETFEFQKSARLVCYEECRECRVVLDQKHSEKIEPFLKKAPKTYYYDTELGMQEIEPRSFFDRDGIEHRSCFSFTLYKDGNVEQELVEYDSKVYDLGSYFETRVYDSIEEAQDAKERLLLKVLS